MVTIREVARQARVSVGTVSNVLAGSATVRAELRRRVENAMQGLDYHPNQIARSLKTRQTKTLGMIISDITNPFFPQVVRGAEDAAIESGFLLIMLNSDDNPERERRALSMLRARKVDGLLLTVASTGADMKHVEQFRDSGLPVVCLDRKVPNIPLDLVCADNAHGAKMCMQHLLSRGHRRIGYLSGSAGLYTAVTRLDGFNQALAEARHPRRPKAGAARRLPAGKRIPAGQRNASRPRAAHGSLRLQRDDGLRRSEAIHELGLRCPEDVRWLCLTMFRLVT